MFPIYDSFAVASVKNLLGRMSGGLTSGHTEYRDFCERLNLLRVRDGLENVGVPDTDRSGFGVSGLRSVSAKNA